MILQVDQRLLLDPNSPFWEESRQSVPKLTKAQKTWTDDIKASPRFPDTGETQQSPLEKRLQDDFEWSLVKTSPEEQDQRFYILHGPPGTSKTHAAKAMARRMGLSVMHVMPSQVHTKWIGEAGKVLKAIFRKAALNQPCLLFFDEFEDLGGSRERMSEHSAALTAELLQYLSGLEGHRGIIVVGCTNDA
jgi:SpoVK/Ycf46/Vps4 family AAA+-type ATPase